MSETVFDRLRRLLDEHHVAYDVMRHEAVYTSEEAARVRGTSLASGAKALICRGDGQWWMFVLPANLRLASRQVRRALRLRSLRFARREEVESLTGLTPGSIPPFGSLFEIPTCCDERLAQQERINFNAGDHCISVSMRYEDFVRVESPRLGSFAEEAE